LVLAVLCVIGFDLIPKGKGDGPVEGSSGGDGWNYDLARLRDKDPRIGVQYSNENRFGVVMLDANDPGNKDAWKRLTMRENGSTNNTIVKIAGHEYTFGTAPGYWAMETGEGA